MRVPNEKQVATIRMEGEFPAGLPVCDFEFKPGWKIDFKKDERGKIAGATSLSLGCRQQSLGSRLPSRNHAQEA